GGGGGGGGGGGAGARRGVGAAPAADRRLRADRPRHRAAARPDRAAVREAHRARADRRVEPLPRRAARGAAAAAARRSVAEPPVRNADEAAAAPVPHLRERSVAADARLRLLGREPAP